MMNFIDGTQAGTSLVDGNELLRGHDKQGHEGGSDLNCCRSCMLSSESDNIEALEIFGSGRPTPMSCSLISGTRQVVQINGHIAEDNNELTLLEQNQGATRAT